MKEIRLAIVGSRGFNDYERLCAAVSALAEREQLCVVGIVSGGVRGVDSLGARYAHEHGLQLTEFLPEHDKYGRGAPLIRNKTIIENADYVLAIWDGVSRGTHNAIGHAQNLSKPLLVERFDNK